MDPTRLAAIQKCHDRLAKLYPDANVSCAEAHDHRGELLAAVRDLQQQLDKVKTDRFEANRVGLDEHAGAMDFMARAEVAEATLREVQIQLAEKGKNDSSRWNTLEYLTGHPPHLESRGRTYAVCHAGEMGIEHECPCATCPQCTLKRLEINNVVLQRIPRYSVVLKGTSAQSVTEDPDGRWVKVADLEAAHRP